MLSSTTASGAGAQRAVLACAVALVAHRLLGEHLSWLAPSSAARRRARSARVGGQEDLQLGVGRDDGADVAALGDPVAAGHELLLARDERLAHTGVGRHDGGCLRDLGRADRVAHVDAVEQHRPAVARSSIRSLRASTGACSPGARSCASATQRYIAPVSR